MEREVESFDIVKNLIYMVVKSLVTCPEEVTVIPEITDEKILYIVTTKFGDEGLLLGSTFRVANSIRSIAKACARRNHYKRRVYVHIHDSRVPEF